MRQILIEPIEAIGPCSHSKIGASEGHVQTKRLAIFQQIPHLISNSLSSDCSPIKPPLGEPSTIDLPPKNKTIFGSQRRELDIHESEKGRCFAQSYMSSRKVRCLPECTRVLDVELTLHAEILPHLQEVQNMLVAVPNVAEFILNLQHYDVAPVH